MTRVVVHRDVVSKDLRHLRKNDRPAADAAVALIRQLESSPQRGRKLEHPGWRAYEVERGVAVIATGVGSGTIRVIGVGRLPTVYDPVRLRSMAESAVAADKKLSALEAGVPAPAPRSRIVSLAEAEGTLSYRDPGPRR